MLTVPTPPSVNEMYSNRGASRKKSKVYADWKGHAGWTLKPQLVDHETFDEPLLAVIQVERTSSRADIDNRVKALFDLLVAHRVIKNDNLFAGFAVAWGPKGSGLCRAMVLPVCNLLIQYHPSTDGATGGWFPALQHEQENALWL